MNNDILNDLSGYVDRLRKKYNFPGISVAVLKQGKLHAAASGVINIDTQVEATTDSAFQIGSITKVFTTTLVMQLVDEGRIDLDKPVIHYLCDFKVASDYATHNITVRQLLNHTNGLEGDFFAVDKPSGGNQLARFVDRCDLLPQSHPPDKGFAYSNTAFAIAGRLVEVVSGHSWHSLIKQKVVEPLALERVVVSGPESTLFRTARGHLPSEDGSSWQVAEAEFPRGMDPVGSTLAMSASDIVRFANAHIDASRGISESWISTSSSQQMQKVEVSLPLLSPLHVTDWGLGWSLYQKNNLKVFGHDGGTVGQCAMLRVVPEHDLIFAVLINCDVYLTAMPQLFTELMTELMGVKYIEAEPSDIDLDLENYCGHYHSMGQEYEVYLEAQCLKCRVVIKTSERVMIEWDIKPINQTCFAVYTAAGIRSFNIHFIFKEQGSTPHQLFAFLRLNSRINH